MTNLTSWKVLARINSSSSAASSLIGKTEVFVDENGVALFTNLGFSYLDTNIILEYILQPPVGVNM